MYWLLVVAAVPFVYVLFSGAPYLPTLSNERGRVLGLLNLSSKDTLIDLGSGDGGLLLQAAHHGIRSIGYERNIALVIISRIRLFPHRKLCKVYWKNMWTVQLPPQTTAVYCFLVPRLMRRLEIYLQQQTVDFTFVSYANKLPSKVGGTAHGPFYVYEFTHTQLDK